MGAFLFLETFLSLRAEMCGAMSERGNLVANLTNLSFFTNCHCERDVGGVMSERGNRTRLGELRSLPDFARSFSADGSGYNHCWLTSIGRG